MATDYTRNLLTAFATATTASGSLVKPTREWMLNADSIAPTEVEAMKAVLKTDGIDAAIISKYCGKNGLYNMARGNAPLVGEFFANPANAKLTSVQTLYARFKAALDIACAVGGSGDDLADAEARLQAEAAAKIEKQAKSAEQLAGELSPDQLASAIIDAARKIVSPKARVAMLRTIGDRLNAEAYEVEKAIERAEREMATA